MTHCSQSQMKMSRIMRMKGKNNERNLTEGIIWKQLLLFALPLLGSSFIQQLYNTVDLLFVGNLLEKEATAAVGASSLVITCIVGFFTGLSVGTGVIVSLALGAGEKKKIEDTIHTAMGLSLAGGAVLSVIGIALAEQFLRWMNTPEEILPAAVSYARIYFLSMIPIVTYNMNSGILRALGNSKMPMLIQFAGGIVNIIMDYVSIRYWHMGVDGVAWATMGSQGAAAFLSVLSLMKGEKGYRLRWKKLRIRGSIFREILKLGVPAGLQSMVITLSNVFIQYAINGFGVDEIAAFAAYFKVELLIYLPIVAFGQAMMTFSGQNAGAGKPERIKKGVRVCIAMGILYAATSAALLLIFGRPVFGLFQKDPDVIACGLRIIRITFPFYWLYVILEVLADAIRGMGRSVVPMILILANICVLRTALLILFTRIFGTLESVAAVYPCAWLAAALSLIIYWKKNM